MLVDVQEAQRGGRRINPSASTPPVTHHRLFNVLLMLVTFFSHISVCTIPGSK
jgi:hypothetical protein